MSIISSSSDQQPSASSAFPLSFPSISRFCCSFQPSNTFTITHPSPLAPRLLLRFSRPHPSPPPLHFIQQHNHFLHLRSHHPPPSSHLPSDCNTAPPLFNLLPSPFYSSPNPPPSSSPFTNNSTSIDVRPSPLPRYFLLSSFTNAPPSTQSHYTTQALFTSSPAPNSSPTCKLAAPSLPSPPLQFTQPPIIQPR